MKADFKIFITIFLILLSSFLIIIDFYFVASLFSYSATILTIFIFLVSTSKSFKIHWRTIFPYCINLILSILFIKKELLTNNNNDDDNIYFIFAIILIIFSFLSVILLFVFPVPTSSLISDNIGTISFTLNNNETINDQIFFQNNKSIIVQCWYPIKNNEQISLLSSIYNFFVSNKAVLWTSGHPLEQTKELSLLLKSLSINFKFPEFFLQHLLLSTTSSIFQKDFSSIIDDKDGQKLPIAIYCHGMYGWRNIHSTCCELLASKGFIVFSLDHPNDCMISRPILDLDNSVSFNYHVPKGSSREKEREFYHCGMNRRVNDLTHFINFLENKGHNKIDILYPHLQNKLDTKNINLWGHSFGGGTISTLCCRDDRPINVVSLDGWLYSMPNEDRKNGFLKSTLLNISSELWDIGKYQVPFRRDLVRNSINNNCKAFDMILKGSDHQDYCDIYMLANNSFLPMLGKNDTKLMMESIDSLIYCFFSRNDSIDTSKVKLEDKSVIDINLTNVNEIFNLCNIDEKSSNNNINKIHKDFIHELLIHSSCLKSDQVDSSYFEYANNKN